MKIKKFATLLSYFILLFCITTASAEEKKEGEIVDFSDQITPLCQVAKLSVAPPAGWINVPINTGAKDMQGCQMMLIIDLALIGVLRVLSFDLTMAPQGIPPWKEYVIGVESVSIKEMGYRIKEVIWRKAKVPITGQGFTSAEAFGFSTEIEGNGNPQEAHLLVFENSTHKYLISLLTPAESVDAGVHYQRNGQGMAKVMQTLKASK